jgi:hypothetical protein
MSSCRWPDDWWTLFPATHAKPTTIHGSMEILSLPEKLLPPREATGGISWRRPKFRPDNDFIYQGIRFSGGF